MANVIQAIITNVGREALAKSFGGVSGGFDWSYGVYFKIGTAAYIDNGSDLEPVSPDPALTDIQSTTSGVFWYRKTFDGSDILFISPATIQFRCFLDLLEANGDDSLEPDTGATADGPKNSPSLSGGTPKLFELGVFDNLDRMVGYATFPGETKLDTKTLNHLVNFNF